MLSCCRRKIEDQVVQSDRTMEQDEGNNEGDQGPSGDDSSLWSSSESSAPPSLEQSSLPLPCDHSYLSGASHPLLVQTPSSLAEEESSEYSPLRRNATTELAILELQGVVLFPGCTIPVKLRDRSLISYLGHQIEVCRNIPHRQPQVRLGVLTYQYGNGHRFVGRIGTIATIQYTQERTDETQQPHHVWRRYQDLAELVFTAVGTGRFEVVAPVVDSLTSTSGRASVYQVREIWDTPLLLPPLLGNHRKLFSTRPSVLDHGNERDGDDSDKNDEDPPSLERHWRVRRHHQLTWNLSILTSTPYIVYDRNWPWKLVDELIVLLQENQGKSNLPHLGNYQTPIRRASSSLEEESPQSTDDFSLISPTQFSFWLSSNMPFTQQERLELLEMPSTLERLRRIRTKVLELVREQQVCYLGCSRCEIPLSPVAQVFSFQGAEGASSNYVNDHGYIHQVTTLRSVVDERQLYYQGPPSTENSYFPGFSWTITYCRRCASLLGWKFQRVTSTPRGPATKNCPDMFFGFQSSSVKTLRRQEEDDDD